MIPKMLKLNLSSLLINDKDKIKLKLTSSEVEAVIMSMNIVSIDCNKLDSYMALELLEKLLTKFHKSYIDLQVRPSTYKKTITITKGEGSAFYVVMNTLLNNFGEYNIVIIRDILFKIHKKLI